MRHAQYLHQEMALDNFVVLKFECSFFNYTVILNVTQVMVYIFLFFLFFLSINKVITGPEIA